MKAGFSFLILFFLNLTCFAQIPYGNNPAVGKYIILNGVNHYYEVYGEGPPLLVIHGNKTATPGNAPQIEYFSKKYKVYSVDCRGRGKSDLGKDSLTFIGMAKDLSDFITQLKLDSVNIIGKSDGAIVAILMAIYYPEHIRKIAAFAANLEPDTNAMYKEGVEGIHQERVEAEKMLAKGDTTKNWTIEKLRYRMMEFQPHVTANELHRINIPVLVMSCDRDVIKPEHTLFIYNNIKYSNLCILPGERHHVPRENPALFNSTIDKYFSDSYKNHKYRFE